MTGKGNTASERKNAAMSALISAGCGAGAALLLSVLFSAFMLFAPEPSDLYFPAGLAALYAGAAAAGILMKKRTGSAAAALLPGASIAALAAIVGAFVKGTADRPVPLTVALFLLVPAVSFVAASTVARKKKKRPSVKRRPRKRR